MTADVLPIRAVLENRGIKVILPPLPIEVSGFLADRDGLLKLVRRRAES